MQVHRPLAEGEWKEKTVVRQTWDGPGKGG